MADLLTFLDTAPVTGSLIIVFCVSALFFAFARSFYAWYFLVGLVSLVMSLVLRQPLAFYVFALGTLAALAEFVGKFKDEPLKALRTAEALAYLIFNGLISVFAFVVMLAYEVPIATLLDQIKIAIIAGLGAMLLMRSRLFNVKIGNDDYAFGPDQIIKVFLRSMEKAIDRARASDRYKKVTEVMDGIDFEKVHRHAVIALDATQVLTEAEKNALITEIGNIKERKNDYSPQQQSHALGFLILDEMGEDFLETVFAGLPLTMMLRAPFPSEVGIFQHVPFVGDKTEAYMAFASSMSLQRLQERLGWDEIDPQRVEAAVSRRSCKLPGYRLEFNVPDPNDTERQRGFANIVSDTTSEIEGVVYKLTKDAITFLDRTEAGYARVEVSPIVGGKPVKAFAYIGTNTDQKRKPSQRYLSLVVAAARENNLSKEYISKLESFAAI